MRTALSISTLALIVIIAFGFRIGAFSIGDSRPTQIAADVNEGRSVRIYSCGATLPPVLFGNRPQRSTIYVDGKMLNSYFNQTGLRLVTIPPGDAPPTLYTFYLPRDVDSPGSLLDLIRSIPIDTAIALASFRTIQPKGKQAGQMRDEVQEALKSIGAQTDPTADNMVSWGILSLRRPGGWLPLSEVYSKTKGMSIAYNLEDDRSRYDGIKPVLRIDQNQVQHLGMVSEQASLATEGVRVETVNIQGSAKHSILMPLVAGAGVRWRFVKLGHFPIFECELGIPSDAYPFVPGALCSLLINGEVIATSGIGKDAKQADAWLPWRVDLSAYSDRWVTLELRATPLTKTLPVSVFWARTAIQSSPSKAPKVSGFDRMLSTLDINRDGVVGPPEVSNFMRLQDVNNDGYITEQEAFKPGVVKGVDRDNDERASYEELESWFGMLLDPPN
ncbi:MAG: hypothetical protein ACI8TQ_001031 [Planctomycetota bacterium]|jgi:hypothetical protein